MNNDYQWPSGCLGVSPKFLKDSSLDRSKITQELETFFSTKLGYPCILLPSGRSAISLALMSLDINRNHTVFAPKYSSYCVWNVLGRFTNPSIQINKDIDLILAVHKYAEIYSLKKSNKKHIIIEDSCDSLIKEKESMFPLGGAFEIFSLPKIMGTYGGGILACSSSAHEQNARRIMRNGPESHHSQGFLRWQYNNGQNDCYNIWEANEFQNFFLDVTSLRQIADNIDAIELNKKIINERFSYLAQNYQELKIFSSAGRLPPAISIPGIKENSNLIHRMIDVKKSLDNPSYEYHAILPLHFGINDQEFTRLLESIDLE